MVRLPRNEKQKDRLNSRVQMWPSGLTLAVTLTFIFQGQIWNLLYLSQEWSDCHEKKSKRIDWTLGLKCGHRVCPWPWPWPRFFKDKYGISYISARNGPIATKPKANRWTSGLTLALDFQGQIGNLLYVNQNGWAHYHKTKNEFMTLLISADFLAIQLAFITWILWTHVHILEMPALMSNSCK